MLYISGKIVPDFPAIITPLIRQRLLPGQLWAADNARYRWPDSYTDESFLAWLEKLSPQKDLCLFACAPDVVGDAAKTIELSLPMLPRIRALGYKAAFVTQGGLRHTRRAGQAAGTMGRV